MPKGGVISNIFTALLSCVFMCTQIEASYSKCVLSCGSWPKPWESLTQITPQGLGF